MAYLDDGRERYWYVDRTYWAESNGTWTAIDLYRFFNELGWSHIFSDPVSRLANFIEFAKADNFELSTSNGQTELTATEVEVPGRRHVRDIRFVIDDESNTITEFGWTLRTDSGHCFKRVDARNGTYEVELTLPDEIAQTRS